MLRSDVFSCFVFYAVLLILKMYFLAILTGQLRLRKKVSRVPLQPLYKSKKYK
jgi:prostaglandin-E synthase 1